MRPAPRLGIAWIGVLVLLGGCAGGGVSSDLSARPEPYELSRWSGERLSLPADRPYSITLAPTNESPGLDGQADADAQVQGSGAAELTAWVKNGGSARAEARLGHSFRNDTNQQVDLEFQVALEHSFVCTAEAPNTNPEARIGLALYARNDRTVVVRDFTLIEHSSDRGNAARQQTEQLAFTLTLSPGERMDVFLSGLLTVETPLGRGASAEMKFGNVRMDILRKVAPPVASRPADGNG